MVAIMGRLSFFKREKVRKVQLMIAVISTICPVWSGGDENRKDVLVYKIYTSLSILIFVLFMFYQAFFKA